MIDILYTTYHSSHDHIYRAHKQKNKANACKEVRGDDELRTVERSAWIDHPFFLEKMSGIRGMMGFFFGTSLFLRPPKPSSSPARPKA